MKSKLTTNEEKALQAIVKSEYQDGRNEATIDHDVWTKYCNPFHNKATQGGVYASLSKKGFIRVGFLEDGQGRNHLDTVCITQEGYAALRNSLEGDRTPTKPQLMKKVRAATTEQLIADLTKFRAAANHPDSSAEFKADIARHTTRLYVELHDRRKAAEKLVAAIAKAVK